MDRFFYKDHVHTFASLKVFLCAKNTDIAARKETGLIFSKKQIKILNKEKRCIYEE